MDLASTPEGKKKFNVSVALAGLVLTVIIGGTIWVTLKFSEIENKLKDADKFKTVVIHFMETVPISIRSEKETVSSRMNSQIKLGMTEMSRIEGRIDRKDKRNANNIEELEKEVRYLRDEIIRLKSKHE